jgi:hypothetical protein
MTRFESDIVDHIRNGAEWLVFNVKCRTKDRYTYTLTSKKVERVGIDEFGEFVTLDENHFFGECVKVLDVCMQDIRKNIKEEGLLFLNEEMRFVNKDIVSDIWVDISLGDPTDYKPKRYGKINEKKNHGIYGKVEDFGELE